MDNRERQQNTGGKLRKLGRHLLTAAISLAALAVTAGMLGTMMHAGSPGGTTVAATGKNVMADFDGYVAAAVGDSLEGLEPIRWIYELNDSDILAPEPNPACYGTAEDPAQLGWLLDEAARTLNVRTNVFTTQTEIMAGSVITYYLDDSIFVVTWKQVVNRSVYTMSEVKIAHASQFRRYLSDGVYGSEGVYQPSDMAIEVNAVTASSGDFYSFRSLGVSVYLGEVKDVHTTVDTCFIDANGDLLFSRAGEIGTLEEARRYVTENNIRFSLMFGPVMVEDGVNVVPPMYYLGEINDKYARAALCQVDELHYLLVAANQEGPNKGLVTAPAFADALIGLGVQKAYALDGGQTAAIITGDTLINRPVYGYQRRISDIIYFATAIPEDTWNGQ